MPYLFIIGMVLFSRGFQSLIDKGQLNGVKLAPTANILTNCIYADDLLVFGSATDGEATCIMELLDQFSFLSGQKIGPDKSFLWYSHATTTETRERVVAILQVQGLCPSTRYPCAPVSAGAQSHHFLIEKFSSRLNTWKSKTLPQAGRLILIKATLTSLPVYYMSTSRIPVSVTKELTRLMRDFF